MCVRETMRKMEEDGREEMGRKTERDEIGDDGHDEVEAREALAISSNEPGVA